MKKSFSKFFLAPLTVLVLASFALAPIAEAGRGGGGGGTALAVQRAAAAVVARMPVVAATGRSITAMPTCVPTMCAIRA